MVRLIPTLRRPTPPQDQAEAQTWLAYHVYWSGNWHAFYATVFERLITAINKMEGPTPTKWFFIRYWEDGEHVRIRFLVNASNVPQVGGRVQDIIKQYLVDHPSQREKNFPNYVPNDSIAVRDYHQEVARYGGPVGMQLAEDIFCASSHCAINVIRAHGETVPYGSLIKFAFISGYLLAKTTAWNDKECHLFFGLFFENWFGITLSRMQIDADANRTKYIEKLERSYLRQREMFTSTTDDIDRRIANNSISSPWRAWTAELKTLYSRSREGIRAKTIQDTSGLVSHSLKTMISTQTYEEFMYWIHHVHMTNNRFGIKNADEFMIGYFLLRLYQDRISQNNG